MAARRRSRETLDVVSWNVNGLRALARREPPGDFLSWLRASAADLVLLQEVRARPDQLEPALRRPRGWCSGFVAAERAGYSGVGFYARRAPDETRDATGEARFDVEGRLQIARFGRLVVGNAYFPNGNGTVLPNGKRTNDRVPYKLAFYRKVFDALAPAFQAGEPVLVVGDFNTAHRPIDLARPSTNKATSGFLDEEREELDRWLRAGWVDTFRHVHGDRPGAYSWWSNRQGVRERNVGWRLDLVLASPGALSYVRDAFIHDHVGGSDHCPVGVTLDRAVLGAPEPPAAPPEAARTTRTRARSLR